MQSGAHILIVDDDREIRDLLSRFLTRHGLRAEAVGDGRAMQQRLDAGRFDLIVLDLMLPGEDGLALCRRLRATSSLPIIMLTAVAEDTDRIIGLEMGADDYVTKPFNPRELLARIKAVLRRSEGPEQGSPGTVLTFAGWRIDRDQRQLHAPDGRVVTLTSGEFDLLLVLAERPQRVLSRDQLLDLTKGRDAHPFDRSIDVQLSRLRRKIELDSKQPRLIRTVRGGGYMLAHPVERA
jgi:two-component system OmpR family response regulator